MCIIIILYVSDVYNNEIIRHVSGVCKKKVYGPSALYILRQPACVRKRVYGPCALYILRQPAARSLRTRNKTASSNNTYFQPAHLRWWFV